MQINTFAVTINAATDVCKNSPFEISATTNSEMGTWSWNFGNGNTSTSSKPTVMYSDEGEYTVSVRAESALGCVATATKKISVHAPVEFDFSSDKIHGCEGSDLVVNYSTSSYPDVTWTWDFGDSNKETTSNASIAHTYQKTGAYDVTLVATTKFNCRSTKKKLTYVKIADPVASILINSNDKEHFCVGSDVIVSNTTSSVATVKTVNWNITSDDAKFTTPVSTSSSSKFTLSKSGVIVVKMDVVDVDGCTSSVVDTLKAGDKLPNPIVTAPLESCYKAEVDMNVSDLGKDNTKWYWSFGDGTDTTYTESNFSYKFQKPDDYTMKTVAKHFECPSDTVETSISIKPPKADFKFTPEVLCHFPGEITFDASESIGALEYEWDFGDGSPKSSLESPSHQYTKAAVYLVKLITTNGACTDEKTLTLNTTGLKVGFKQSKLTICKDEEITFTDTSSVKSGIVSKYIWDFGDGTIDTVFSPSYPHKYETPGEYKVALKVTTVAGCVDSVKGPETYTVYTLPQINDFKANITDGCAPLDVAFINTVTADYAIQSYSWDFGDGKTGAEGSLEHTFEQAKSYDVALTVKDIHQCSDTKTKPGYVTATFPEPMYTIPDVICSYDSLEVVNTSTGVDLSYVWKWGDGKTANTVSPKHLYTDLVSDTTFEVVLQVKDVNGCESSISKTIKVGNPKAQFESPQTEYQCPPAEVEFYNKSTGNDLKYSWNFGEPITTPIVLKDAFWQYYVAGNYDVTLVAEDSWGCSDTMSKPNYITVNGPKGSLVISPSKACVYDEFSFSAENTEGVVQYSWIYGDGEFSTTTDNSAKYTYSIGNVYTPSLTIIDANGCEVSLFGGDVTVYGVQPDFKGQLTACQIEDMQIEDASVTSPAPIESWKWVISNASYRDTIKAQNINQQFDYGMYDVQLITEVQGCIFVKDSIQGLKVFQTPTVDFSVSKNPVEMLETLDFTNESDSSAITEKIYWKWLIGDDVKKESSFSYYFTVSGDIDVSLLGYTHEECIDTMTQVVTVDRNIRIPNVFTPNGDGINDIFMEGYPDVALVIINRWGQEIYRGLGGWNGKCNGQEMSAGTYFYMITLPNGEKIEGPLMLIRN
ncbi:MAG: PKD domain-containing protein [Bacteroidales bacterium]|nr:PKD domain-containing protein [Bacteroidales bacterium]